MSDGQSVVSTQSSAVPPEGTFVFKVMGKDGLLHRVRCTTCHLPSLIRDVTAQLNLEPSQRIARLKYEDEEGDTVVLTSDSSVYDAISMARQEGMKSLKLSVDILLQNGAGDADGNTTDGVNMEDTKVVPLVVEPSVFVKLGLQDRQGKWQNDKLVQLGAVVVMASAAVVMAV